MVPRGTYMNVKYDENDFLPVSAEDMQRRGWWWYDFLLVTGDAYVDHPASARR